MIAGLGLIGGSLALNIKKNTNVTLIGYDTNQKTLNYALLHGMVDEISTTFSKSVVEVDICILAAPVSKTVDLIQELKKIQVSNPLLVTDVSSVKQPILDAANELDQTAITFIGGHPMAGSHKKGIEAAKGHLFENAIYVLTPSEKVAVEKIDELKQLLSGTKSTFLELDPIEHDEMTSIISHFPHLIASSLVHQAKKWQKKHGQIANLAAGGFRDITRIASSNPAMWQDIFFQNKTILSHLLHDWINEMKELQSLLETDDKISMYHYLEQAREYRDRLDKKKQGAILSFYDLYVDIFDQTGAIATVVAILADEDISIKNIEILEIREGITGVLRLSLTTQEDQLRAHQVLTRSGYETMLQE